MSTMSFISCIVFFCIYQVQADALESTSGAQGQSRKLGQIVPTQAPARMLAPAVVPTRAPRELTDMLPPMRVLAEPSGAPFPFRVLAPAVIPTGAPIRVLAEDEPTGVPFRVLAPAVIPTGAPIRVLATDDKPTGAPFRVLAPAVIPTGAPIRVLATDGGMPIRMLAEDDIEQKINGLTVLSVAEQRKVVQELKPIIENVKNSTQRDDLKHHLAETVPELVDTTEDGKMFFWPIWTKRALSAETVETNVSEKFFWPIFTNNRQLSAETEAHEGDVNESDNGKMYLWYRNLAAEDDIQQKIAGLVGLSAAEQHKAVEELKPTIDNIKSPIQQDDVKHFLAEKVPDLQMSDYWPNWTKRHLSAHVSIEKAIDGLNEMQPTEQRLVIQELKTVVDNVKNPVQRDELEQRIAEKVPELVQTTEDGKMFFWPIWTKRALSAEMDVNEGDNSKMFFWPISTKRALSAETLEASQYGGIFGSESADTWPPHLEDGVIGLPKRALSADTWPPHVEASQDGVIGSDKMLWNRALSADTVETPQQGDAVLSAQTVETPQQGDADEGDKDKMFFWPIWTARSVAPAQDTEAPLVI